MSHRTPFLMYLAAFLFLQPLATEETQPELATITHKVTGGFTQSSGTSTLVRTEMVKILSASPGMLVVQRVNNPPDWETKDARYIERAKTPMRIPEPAAARLSKFSKVTSWDAGSRGKFTACDGGCDSGTTYRFRNDGSFTAVFEPGNSVESPPATKAEGHLYTYHGLYWAKFSKGLAASQDLVFYNQGEKAICTRYGCEEDL